MTKERAQELQANISKEAIAMLVIHGNVIETNNYKKTVELIGKAWSLPAEDTEQRLAMIEQEKDVVNTTCSPQPVAHVLPESELPMNATGMQTLDNVWDLFETAVMLDSREERQLLFDLAQSWPSVKTCSTGSRKPMRRRNSQSWPTLVSRRRS